MCLSKLFRQLILEIMHLNTRSVSVAQYKSLYFSAVLEMYDYIVSPSFVYQHMAHVKMRPGFGPNDIP